MPNPHHTMSHSLDPYPVRPGTSAALTARTIDATVHTPLVRAQETVTALIPRVTEPLGSPLFLATIGLTLVLISFAIAGRFRPRGLVLAALLMMTLTSFKPLRPADEVELPDQTITTDGDAWWRRQLEKIAQPIAAAAARYAEEAEIRTEAVEPTEQPDDVMTPDTRIRIYVPREIMMRYREQELRAAIQELRMRMREEVRQRRRHRH
ncbi:MAG: hypothetical protein ACJ78K_11735 [Gemmatimonadaceae bacterium]